MLRLAPALVSIVSGPSVLPSGRTFGYPAVPQRIAEPVFVRSPHRVIERGYQLLPFALALRFLRRTAPPTAAFLNHHIENVWINLIRAHRLWILANLAGYLLNSIVCAQPASLEVH
jgi:hypothetical protein